MHTLDLKLLREKLLDYGMIFICYNANDLKLLVVGSSGYENHYLHCLKR
jgi:hypothetical protein